MAKKYSVKFWIIFWTCCALFLTGWYLYWQTKNNGFSAVVDDTLKFLPIDASAKKEYAALSHITEYFMQRDDKERTALVLFQNNMEIRPGGGFIGAFGIVKIKNGSIVSMETHDLSNFDGRIPDTEKPPYPMEETLRIKSWKLRDSNYSPDFKTNAKKALEFYYMGQGQEKFDAVIGVTANMLTSMLEVTGPVQIEGYPGTYNSQNAVLALEYQVEKAFEEQGIDRGDRKSVMNDLAKVVQEKVWQLSPKKKMQLAEILLRDLRNKDIQLYFTDENLEKIATEAQWTGNVNTRWSKDYLMMVDANLGAFKSDYYVKRSYDYTVDLRGETPQAILKITYKHTAKQKDWMTKDYLSYLRVYAPNESWFVSGENFDNVQYGNEFGKKYFGAIVRVGLDSEKTVTLKYSLPKSVAHDYDLLVQKQAGLKDIPLTLHLIIKEGVEDYTQMLDGDIIFTDKLSKNK